MHVYACKYNTLSAYHSITTLTINGPSAGCGANGIIGSDSHSGKTFQVRNDYRIDQPGSSEKSRLISKEGKTI